MYFELYAFTNKKQQHSQYNNWIAPVPRNFVRNFKCTHLPDIRWLINSTTSKSIKARKLFCVALIHWLTGARFHVPTVLKNGDWKSQTHFECKRRNNLVHLARSILYSFFLVPLSFSLLFLSIKLFLLRFFFSHCCPILNIVTHS